MYNNITYNAANGYFHRIPRPLGVIVVVIYYDFVLAYTVCSAIFNLRSVRLDSFREYTHASRRRRSALILCNITIVETVVRIVVISYCVADCNGLIFSKLQNLQYCILQLLLLILDIISLLQSQFTVTFTQCLQKSNSTGKKKNKHSPDHCNVSCRLECLDSILPHCNVHDNVIISVTYAYPFRVHCSALIEFKGL